MYEIMGCNKVITVDGKKVVVPEWDNICSYVGDPAKIQGCFSHDDGERRPDFPQGLGHDNSEAVEGCMRRYGSKMVPWLQWPEYYSSSELYERCCFDTKPCPIPQPRTLEVSFADIGLCDCSGLGDPHPNPLPVAGLPTINRIYLNADARSYSHSWPVDGDGGHWSLYVGFGYGGWTNCTFEAVLQYTHPDNWYGSPPSGYIAFKHRSQIDFNSYEPNRNNIITVELENGVGDMGYGFSECCDWTLIDDSPVYFVGDGGTMTLVVNIDMARYTRPAGFGMTYNGINLCPEANPVFSDGCGSGTMNLDTYRLFNEHYCTRAWHDIYVGPVLTQQSYSKWVYGVTFDPWWLKVVLAQIGFVYSSSYIYYTFDSGSVDGPWNIGTSISNIIPDSGDCSQYRVGYGGQIAITGGNLVGNGTIAEWDPSKTYERMEFVSYEETIYRSLKDGNLGNQPDENEDWWSDNV